MHGVGTDLAIPQNDGLSGGLLFQLLQCRLNGFLRSENAALTLVGLASPDESPGKQAVFFPAGNNMNVKVHYPLTDPVIDGDKGTIGFQAQFKSAGQNLGLGEEWLNEMVRQVKKGFIVLPGNYQDMTSEQGLMIEESESIFILKNNEAFDLAPHDPAKSAFRFYPLRDVYIFHKRC